MTISDLMAKAEYAQELLAEIVGIKDEAPDGVQLCAVTPEYIHVYKGIGVLARKVCTSLSYKLISGPDYNVEWYFEHDGKRYIQLEKCSGMSFDATEGME